ncbi:MAG: TRL-like family protein [Bacteroidota bacterium]
MKKLGLFVVTLMLGAFMASCSMTMPVNATSNEVGSKVGTSKGSCYLGALCFGVDASIKSAAKNGNVKRISTVDMKVSNILGIVITYETMVTGE